MWQKEFKETGSQLRRISQFSSPELIRRLQEALEALDISDVQHAILPNTKYSSYSLGYEQADRTCVVWTEDGNMTSFCNVMKACKKVKEAKVRGSIYLIRKEKLGTPKNKGYKIWQEVFSDESHQHLKPDLVSVQYLETYHRLVNAAAGGELVIGAKTPHVKDLQAFMRESNVLANCNLLQQLGVFPPADGGTVGPPVIPPVSPEVPGHPGPSPEELAVAERYILNIMATQSLVGMQVLVENTQDQVPTLDSDTVMGVIHSLSKAQRVQILDPNAKPENQILCHVPA